MTNVKLYHGGHQNDIYTMQSYGLSRERDFYCTRHQSLAQAASEIHSFEGMVIALSIPQVIFNECIRFKLWEEKPYLGCIQVEGTREVIVNRGLGIDILNFLIEVPLNYIEEDSLKRLKKTYPALKSMNF